MEELMKKLEAIENDLAFDRSKLDEILVKVEGLESRVKAIEHRMPRTENKMEDALTKVLSPLLNTPKIKRNKSFFKKLLGGGK